MDSFAFGFIISALLVVVLIFLFRYEDTRGARIFEYIRKHADFFVLKSTYKVHEYIRLLRKDFLQQIFHFSFHTILRLALKSMVWCEKVVRITMRKNKIVAKNAERENTTRTKLEEVALHKIKSALSEKEKIAHKEKILQGK